MKKPNRYPYSKSKFYGRIYQLHSASFKGKYYVKDLKSCGIHYQITRSGPFPDIFIKIDNLEQLQALIDKTGHDLILSKDQIWISDDYME
ncbi:hypothetical protein VKP36_05030 [Streptococcus pyogenes]|uniref:hypothetical protein n=1 Tax=Streptococcus pyogenes TaxID=1314 RepID=UPI0010A0D72C|nr:hypothetical protein [Streptococcus pyogenes]HER4615509.1 hypothetical protein [Streptococcus pyogenes NGAS535]HER4819365.1 hypothetical protein [Streptococcus pyogenes NGAS008]WSE72329.1 hypothetical protein VKP36_05030 [Streptococcus pyogenes]VGV42111.1 phage protein [Streptococcus pyogenes]VGV96134.1 phage protein [Streptococcus pyogenes]